MIKRIVIKDTATFDSTGVELDNLQKVNFVYGGNACGKTTISRVLSSDNLVALYPSCKVEWEGQPLQVLTYNKDFRERNFLENIPGVFTLGEASVDAIKEIEGLATQRDECDRKLRTSNSNVAKREEEIKALANERQERLWKNVFKKNEEFKMCLKGFMYKHTFEARILELLRSGIPEIIPTVEDLRNRYKVLFASEGTPLVLEPLPEFIDLAEALADITNDQIWTRRIVGSDDVPIADLIKRLDIIDWVSRGKQLLQPDSDVCPFCQRKTIDQNFRNQLEAFFDENFVKDTERLSYLQRKYIELKDEGDAYFKEIIHLSESKLVDKLNVELFSTVTQLIREALMSNIDIMLSKIKNPGLQVAFKDITEYVNHLQKIIDSTNQAIKEHNLMVENISSEKDALKNDVWNYLTSLAASEVVSIQKSIKGKEIAKENHMKDASALLHTYNILDNEIRKKESQVTSVLPTIQRINNALKKFGFTSFSIQPSPKDNTKYQILREDGTWVENTLSEGETMFISFLYYMHLVRGSMSQADVRTPRVLVIDDPISSLDSNVLFVVSTMIKQLLKEVRESTPGNESNIKQVFVLTHNVYFHKEVSFISNRVKSRKDSHHWVLYRKGNVTSIKSYGQDNPIKGSYELLWKDLRERRDAMDNIEIQNIMRRIIENYFIVFGGLNGKDLITTDKYEDPEELTIATSFASWYDEGSHDIYDDLYVEHPHILTEKYMNVFRGLFDKLGHLAHFNMMMQIEGDNTDA